MADQATVFVEVDRLAELRHHLQLPHHERVKAAANLHELAPSCGSFKHLKRERFELIDIGDGRAENVRSYTEADVEDAVTG